MKSVRVTDFLMLFAQIVSSSYFSGNLTERWRVSKLMLVKMPPLLTGRAKYDFFKQVE